MINKKIFKRLVILIVSLLAAQRGYSAFEERPGSIRAISMGGAGVALAEGASSIYLNPAGVAKLRSPELVATYTTLFGLEELRYTNLAYLQPLRRLGNLGFGWEGFGEGIYKERVAFLSYARKILKGSYVGVNLKHMELSIETIGKATSVGFDLGFIQELGGKVSVGLFSRNTNRPQIGGEGLPSKIAAGIGFKSFEKMILVLDYGITETSTKKSLGSLAVGTEIELTSSFLLRAGVQSSPQRIGLGFGLRQRQLGVDYTYLTHHVLGGSHQLNLILRFQEK